MAKRTFISLFSVFAMFLIVSSSYLIMKRDQLCAIDQSESLIDFPETENQKSPNIEEEIKEVKMASAFSFISIVSLKNLKHTKYYSEDIPLSPCIETVTPPPNFN
jgi:hypothetical protein